MKFASRLTRLIRTIRLTRRLVVELTALLIAAGGLLGVALNLIR